MSQLIDTEALTIRLARAEDERAVTRLAQRDSVRRPFSPLLLAFSGEKLMAAQSITDGQVIADPFEPTSGIVAVLSARTGQLEATERRGLLSRLRLRSLSAQPSG